MQLFASPTLRATAFACIAGFFLSGCAALEGDKIDYKTSSQGKPLEVPPDLTQLSKQNPYQVPGTAVSAKNGTPVAATGANGTASTAALTVGDVKIERNGNQRWLVVTRSPEALWPVLRDFWQDNGFLLTIDEQKLGIMETDWAENRAKLPQDFIRNSIGKVFDQLYSTGERDRFRTRLERLPNGDTEIYVSHRGLVEKLTGVQTPGQVSSTIWETRSPDPELEAEFLRRMMMRLGVTKEQSNTLMAAAKTEPAQTTVKVVGDQVQLELPVGFDVAWRRVGLALDRSGFTVEDRDRSQGIYFVRYAPPKIEAKEPGFLSKLFASSDKDTKVLKYRISVVSSGNQSVVRLLGDTGTAANPNDAQNILKIISQELR